jgi:four helix bundle protein
MKIYFDHERLQAYQSSLDFVRWSEPLLERLARTAAIYNQLDRARTSIPLNIAEGNAKFTPADKCRYFDTAHGSAVECAACLDVLFLKQALNGGELDEGKTILRGVVALLVGLIKSKAPDRFREDEVEYRVGRETESESKSRSESVNGGTEL